MSFVSLRFLIFFPLVTLAYYLVPKRAGRAWLLAASYFFYMNWSVQYALLMAFSTLVTYTGGLIIGTAGTARGKKLGAVFSVTVGLAVLAVFKYAGFFADTLTSLGLATPRTFDIVTPVGISFYTFQSVGYVIDVYRGDIAPERNLLNYALFVSFFPQLVAGPIERAGRLITHLKAPRRFDWLRVRRGMLRMCWGFFMKLVIADRVGRAVDEVYGNIGQYAGLPVAVAIGLFAIQIYCDFGGYSQIAIGAADVLGIPLMQNFDRPYFTRTIQEYWSRWHISLSIWFRDYVFYPIATSRRLRRLFRSRSLRTVVPQCTALLVTFLLSGLWHGAAWTFVLWGAIHGVYQIVGQLTKHGRERFWDTLHVNRSGRLYMLWQIVCVFTLCALADVFFRADSAASAVVILKSLFRAGTMSTLSLSGAEWIAAGAAIAVLFLVDLLSGHSDPWQRLEEKAAYIRWPVYIALLFSVILFGVYGPGYSAASFIYFQF